MPPQGDARGCGAAGNARVRCGAQTACVAVPRTLQSGRGRLKKRFHVFRRPFDGVYSETTKSRHYADNVTAVHEVGCVAPATHAVLTVRDTKTACAAAPHTLHKHQRPSETFFQTAFCPLQSVFPRQRVFPRSARLIADSPRACWQSTFWRLLRPKARISSPPVGSTQAGGRIRGIGGRRRGAGAG